METLDKLELKAIKETKVRWNVRDTDKFKIDNSVIQKSVTYQKILLGYRFRELNDDIIKALRIDKALDWIEKKLGGAKSK